MATGRATQAIVKTPGLQYECAAHDASPALIIAPVTQPEPEYWATLAQVIPVVALGLVAAGRLLTSAWDETTSRVYRGLVSAIYAFVLITLGVSEFAALRALRGGDQYLALWPFTEQAIAFGIGALFLAPAVEVLLRGHTESVAALFTWHPILDRKLRRQTAIWAKLTAERMELLEVRRKHLQESEEWLAEKRELLAESEQMAQAVQHEAFGTSLTNLVIREEVLANHRELVASIFEMQFRLARERHDYEETVRKAKAARTEFFARPFATSAARKEQVRLIRREMAEGLRRLDLTDHGSSGAAGGSAS